MKCRENENTQQSNSEGVEYIFFKIIIKTQF